MFELKNPKDLIDYKNNAKDHSKDQIKKLARSFKEEGFHGCIVTDEDLVIIAGHGRKYAAIEANLASVPVQILKGLTDEQKRSKRLGDNKLAESDWLDDILKQELIFLNDKEYDLALSGFDLDLIVEEKENTNDADDLPEAAEPICQPGDLWQLGNHFLLCGDATILSDVEKLMQTKQGVMIWTDPPYNVAYEGKTKAALKIKNDKMGNSDFYDFLYSSFTNMFMSVLPGSPIYVAHADSEGINFRKAFIDSGFLLKQCLMWNKNHMVLGRQDYHWKHEPILYGWKEGAAHKWYSDRKQTTVLEFKKPQRNGEHPTMKPVELVEYCLLNSSQKDDIVIDLFGGSGTTLLACEKNNRICHTMELDPKYCDVIIARWEKYSNKKAIKIN